MSELKFEISDIVSEEAGKKIVEGLVAFNDQHVAGSLGKKDLLVVARNSSGEIIGGARGYTSRDWLFINHLWVSETARKSGLGARLLQMAEDEAKKRGCFAAHLDTFSFQALDFYKKQGYEIFGELNNFPRGHKRFFLQKSFEAGPAQTS